jgi:hypothetical protein
MAARAQQADKLPTIGYLASDPSVLIPWTAAFVERLRELGWVEGRTVAISIASRKDAPSGSQRSRPSLCKGRSM